MSIITLAFLFVVLGIIGGLEGYILIKFADAFQKMKFMSEAFERSADRLTTLDTSRERVYESVKSVTDSIIDQYKNLFEQYKLLKETYDNISDGFLKVCEVTKEIDEHNVVTCEQFEEISKALADIYAKTIEVDEKVTDPRFVVNIEDDILIGAALNSTPDDDDDTYWDPNGVETLDFPFEEGDDNE